MEIFVQIVEGEKNSTLQMKDASQANEQAVINGFFQLFGSRVEATEKQERSQKRPPAGMVVPPIEVKVPEIPKAPKVETKTESSISKKLPLLGSESRMTQPLSEVARIKPLEKSTDTSMEEPEHWRTGIKIDEDGTKRYKCRYWCSCGNKGNHYVPLDAEYTYCHECDKDIPVETATFEIDKDGIPGRDEYGNFFIARA
ncbi:hypothetical protein ACH0BF_20360 [Pseudobacillus sp. 179-B 2D1 NHS]|uniref:hypothetical protein n=1 Tax=Pseudobacillus sp. 179-B 2D1 NHS TaxID=3374292 RepID=UPI00387A8129